MITKQCECCGVTFEKTKFISSNKWEKRRFCSRDCLAKSMVKHVINQQVKVCEHCGIEFTQKETEHNSAFVIRKFCSRKCTCASHKLQIKGVPKNINKEKVILSFLSNQDVPIPVEKIKAKVRFLDVCETLAQLTNKKLLSFRDGLYEITDDGDDFLCT